MNFKINESATKLRGGYYTPEDVARYLAKWVLGIKPRTILEPSCGDGAFIRALKGQHRFRLSFTGVELLNEEARKSRKACKENDLIDGEIVAGDFLDWGLKSIEEGTQFSAILGNPPYIRYQYLAPQDQILSEELFVKFCLAFTKHTNAWVPFVIASVAMLEAGGRLGMVVPAEILHVLHATSLRKFLLTQCSKIVIVDPNELLFDEALQGTVLLMVEKKKKPASASQGVAVLTGSKEDLLCEEPEELFNNAKPVSGDMLNGKWMKVLLTPRELEVFESAKHKKGVRLFRDVASVDVGIVTGANKFFLVNDETVKEYGLKRYAKPMFGRSGHCPGVIYDREGHTNKNEGGTASNFVMIGNVPMEELPEKVQDYIKFGEEQNLHKRYKCRIRSPWYSVPSVYSTEVAMLKRAHNYPRLILNSARAYTTDTAYRIKTVDPSIQPESLVYGFVNSLTALTGELEGRHYGGGVLEMVPSEIEKMLVPIVNISESDLRRLDLLVRSNEAADDVLRAQDKIVLKAAGFTKEEAAILHEAWRRIRSRRLREVHQEKGDSISDE
ncbi:HsdM family class I SAM-dependent methyltransferase [Prosthecobacter dejongeii]|uniref:Adenine-specific DNA methylase n=1 Tax=Prosthecobacter dejongeii TaxID=48465 RepID=A0A7W7YQN0_9BACT|nr:N-6 DNA methylase [Prosthecobacter dejongeii]MBB5040576.1 adenine-specific DNA methylase [Prosthecobacter dejongeii]